MDIQELKNPLDEELNIEQNQVSDPVTGKTESSAEAQPVDEEKAQPVSEEKAQPVDEEKVPTIDEKKVPVDNQLELSKNDDSSLEENSEVRDGADQKEPHFTPAPGLLSTDDIIAKLQDIVNETPSTTTKHELDTLKQSFYKALRAGRESALREFIDAGGKAENFVPELDPIEEQFKKLLNIIKENRASALEAQEALKQENLKKKLDILERLKDLVNRANTEPVTYNDFKTLLQEWKEIKEVPANQASKLWKSFQQYAEHFYDIQKLNNEFRDYDFKKNMEIKIRLCESAEKLIKESNAVSAFHQLQKLHQEYRETGPIARDSREEIWNRFKSASKIVNRRYQEHFEELKKIERNNYDQKIVICEIIESIDYDSLVKFQHWNSKTQEVIALQKKWKSIGFVPKKYNQKIFERFRNACDEFFKRKGEFFKSVKENMGNNLEKKIKLCEEVESLKDSTDWKKAGDRIILLQKEWKEIGPIPKKHNTTLWKRFIGACDYFFEQRAKKNSANRSNEIENMSRKKEIIEKLSSYDPSIVTESDKKEIQDLIYEWSSIGFVPFKMKDKLNKEYSRVFSILSDTLNLRERPARENYFRGNRNFSSKKDRLTRKYEALKSEIQTYENNLGFLSSSSKSGNTLVNDIQKKISALKEEAENLLNQIKNSDQNMEKEKETKDQEDSKD
ncbi:MAG TPA: DUF349 domain-containing protein [Bacteroidaceae bacterium]|nr:DUF349 domain-containing protein [Bacteroidaceae bacterium]